MRKTNGQLLEDLLEAAVVAGELPYQSNREAIRSLDILSKMDEGRAKLNDTIGGIEDFIRKLEELKNVAQNVSRSAAAIIR